MLAAVSHIISHQQPTIMYICLSTCPQCPFHAPNPQYLLIALSELQSPIVELLLLATIDTLGIRLPIDFAILYQITRSTSGTESYSEGFTLIARILHKIVSNAV